MTGEKQNMDKLLMETNICSAGSIPAAEGVVFEIKGAEASAHAGF